MSLPTIEFVFYNVHTDEIEIWGPESTKLWAEFADVLPELTFLGAL